MGTLEYSFAKAPNTITLSRLRRTREPHEPEAEASGSRLVGELAVHRENLEHILRENPSRWLPFSRRLQALLRTPGIGAFRAEEEIEESTEVCALREV